MKVQRSLLRQISTRTLPDQNASAQGIAGTAMSLFRAWTLILISLAAALPSLFLRLMGTHLAPEIMALMSRSTPWGSINPSWRGGSPDLQRAPLPWQGYFPSYFTNLSTRYSSTARETSPMHFLYLLYKFQNSQQAAPLGPGTIVVADIVIAQELGQYKPGVGRALPHWTADDGILATVDAIPGIDRPQFVSEFECPVLINCLRPWNVVRTGPGTAAQ